MKLVLDDFINRDIIDYLLKQKGITSADLNYKDATSILNIKYDDRIMPETIMKKILQFRNDEYSILLEFDKGLNRELKTLKYIVDDICCEYCYKGLILDLFDNKNVQSVKSNFDSKKDSLSVEFTIKYANDYEEEKLKEYIKDRFN